jgi:hypothetical protein
MNIPQFYAVSLGVLVVLSIVVHTLLSITNVRIYGTFYFLKYVYYPEFPQFMGYPRQTTWFDALILMAFLLGNAICMAINVNGIPDLIKRSALICTINLIPLALGAQMNLIANRCGIRLSAYARIHRWLGRIAIIEGLIHAAASLRKLNIHAREDVAGLIVSIELQEKTLAYMRRLPSHFL